jgi:putative DNA primase/helicase
MSGPSAPRATTERASGPDYDAIAEAVSPDQLARALGATKVGNGWRCPGPYHDDDDPSCSFFRDGSRTAGKCHGCGLAGSPVTLASRVWNVSLPDAAERLVRELGLHVASSNGARGARGQREITATYDYTDETGELLFQAVRYFPKDFRQRRPDGRGGWDWKLGDARRVLYRLPRVAEAVALGKLIHVCEGEKDVHAVEQAGGVATCNPMGAGKWSDEYADTLRGAHVRIVAHDDDAGRKHARAVAGSLEAVAESVEIVQAREGNDAADHLAAGHTLDDFVPCEERAAEDGPDGDSHDAPTLTDTGNASRLIGKHGDRLHYIPPWGRWIVCATDGFWNIDHRDVQVRELAKDVGRQLKREAAKEPDDARAKRLFAYGLASLNARKIGGMVDLARGIEGISLDHEKLDKDGWLLGTKNGVIELRTGRHRTARPEDLMTMRCPVPWQANATAPRWERAVAEWFPDPEVRAYVQRVAGSALVGAQRDHVFVIHYGLGGNGKGTFTRALQAVLGPLATEIHLSLLIQVQHKEHDTVKADLFRARLALAVEVDRRVKLAEASVKNLTGNDRIRGRRMREDPWSFDPTHSLWLQTNHLPEISGRDTGIWRRIRVVKWERTFSGEDEDQDLDETLASEAPGILGWLVEGCLAWQREGLQEPEKVVRDTLAYRRAEDTFSRFQDDVDLVFAPGLEMQAQALQDLLSEWASAEGIDPPSSEVGDWLHEHGCRQKRKRFTDENGKRRQRRFWLGVGLEDGKHESEQIHAL